MGQVEGDREVSGPDSRAAVPRRCFKGTLSAHPLSPRVPQSARQKNAVRPVQPTSSSQSSAVVFPPRWDESKTPNKRNQQDDF